MKVERIFTLENYHLATITVVTKPGNIYEYQNQGSKSLMRRKYSLKEVPTMKYLHINKKKSNLNKPGRYHLNPIIKVNLTRKETQEIVTTLQDF